MDKLLYVDNRKAWRKWLEKNHTRENEIWLVYYKKHTQKKRIPYDDAVEEALCFGWIDSIIRRLDDEKYAQKFTPRKDHSTWSELNKKRVEKMIELGKMRNAGLKKIERAKEIGTWNEIFRLPQSQNIHPDFISELEKNPKAKEYFYRLAPSYKKHYIGWISASKKDETRKNRIKEAIDLLGKNQKLGLK